MAIASLSMKKTKHFDRSVIFVIILVFLTQVPYLFAFLQSSDSFVFAGFLFNPLDGNTYLSKMRQGWEGKWLFELTYSPEKNKPAFLFVFYILLGHLGRIFHLDLIIIFHIARFVATLILSLTLRNFFAFLLEEKKSVELALLWAMFGGGLGWLAGLLGWFTPDFWVAEGYVFLSTFANPHFPLSISLMLWMLTLSESGLGHKVNTYGSLLAGVILANLSPFSYLIVAVVLGIAAIATKGRDIEVGVKSILIRLFLFGMGGTPFLFYQLWVVRQDPILAEWNGQNVTPSPNVFLLILGFFPVILWAAWGMIRAVVEKNSKFIVPIIWIVVSLLFVYFPSSLQRRFLIGLYIPLVAIAVYQLQKSWLTESKSTPIIRFFGINLSLVFSFLTNGVFLFANIEAVQRHDRFIYLHQKEAEALRWMELNLPNDTVILASPISSMFIPAWTGLRVVYGHPFESIQAEERLQMVENFYQGKLSHNDQMNFLANQSVDAILWGIREKEDYSFDLEKQLNEFYPIVYKNDGVTIYQVAP